MTNIVPWRRGSVPSEENRALPLSAFRRDIDRVFDRFYDGMWGEFDGSSAGAPVRLDVRETDNEIVVKAEVPGVDPNELDIQLNGDTLILSGLKKEESQEERGGVSYSERRFGEFRRELRFATPLDPNKVRADQKNGIVTIRLAKAESSKAKRIQVKPS